MAVVAFSFDEFVVRYPEFLGVSPALLAAYFSDAGLYCCNTDRSIVKDVIRRKAMLYALTAHIAALSDPNNHGQLVGHITSAKEGSVGVSVKTAELTQANEWFMQTQYGASYWRLSAPYRSAFYVAPPEMPKTYVPRD